MTQNFIESIYKAENSERSESDARTHERLLSGILPALAVNGEPRSDNLVLAAERRKPGDNRAEETEKRSAEQQAHSTRDGSPKAIMAAAKERQYQEIYRNGYMKITENGRLACAVSVSKVYREAGVRTRSGDPLPIRLKTIQIRNDLINAGWKVLDADKSPSPGDFVEAFAAKDGSGAHHAIIVAEKSFGWFGKIQGWNNNNRSRGVDELKWWSKENLEDAVSEYKGYLVLRPPLAGESFAPDLERNKVKDILRVKKVKR